MLQRRVDDLSLPECRLLMSKMKSILDDGVGFVVIDRLPLDEFPIETLVEVYWVLGQYIGRAKVEWADDLRCTRYGKHELRWTLFRLELLRWAMM